MAVKPVLHRIIVLADKVSERDTAYAAARRAGIQIIETELVREQKAVDTGVVVLIGATAFKDFGAENCPIAIGDRVVYAKYGGKAIVDPVDQVEYIALNDEDIIAVTEGA